MLLKDLCTIKSSKRIFEHEYVLNGIPFVRGQEISDKSIFKEDNKFECYISKERYNEIKLKYGIPKIGDILITAVGTIGNLCYIDRNFDFYYKDGNLIQFTNFDLRLNSKFLYYFMQSPLFKKQLEYSLIGAVQKALTMDMLGKIEINLPDRKIQDKIVEILSNIDNQIERNNCMVKRLQDLGNTTFSVYFKDCKNIVPFTKFPYCEILKPSIDKFDNTKHYIATAEVEGINLNFDAPLITYENRESRANMQPVKNSIWFAKLKNSIKHIYIPNNDKFLTNDYIFSTGFCGIKCDEIAYEFLIGFIESTYFEAMKDKLAHGATMESVNNNDLISINIPLPSEDVLKEYHSKIKKIYEQLSMIQVENYKLNNLKQQLLPLLINGQIEI